jgi:hypothetical protein
MFLILTMLHVLNVKLSLLFHFTGADGTMFQTVSDAENVFKRQVKKKACIMLIRKTVSCLEALLKRLL